VASCEHGNEPLDSIKGEEFLDQLSDYKLLRTMLLGGTYLVIP
jgi:hypothetical protein